MTKTVFITGGTRGVGLEIAKRFAKDGANVVIVGKTVDPHPKLPGTLATATEEIRAAGAKEVLAIPCDVRDLDALNLAITATGAKFGKIDVLVNNASALYLLRTIDLTPSKFNLMHEVIVRASLFAGQFALPYLQKSENPHIIHLAPKPALLAKWFKGHTAYTLCKFSSSMLVIGLASEFAEFGIAVNAIWPKTLLATAAVQNLLGGDNSINHSRHPRIVADAAYILSNKPVSHSGNFHLDEELVNEVGGNLDDYSIISGSKLYTDLYVEEA